MHSALLDSLMVTSLVLLGSGFFYKGIKCHLLRAAGWFVFGLYWFAQLPYWLGVGETINSLGTALSLPVMLYISYHELLSYKWNDDYPPLRFICGASFVASAVFFTVEIFPALSASAVRLVAEHSSTLANAIWNRGYAFTGIDLAGNTLWYTNTDGEIVAMVAHNQTASKVSIALACTGIQAMAATFAFVSCSRASIRRRVIALGIMLPVIYMVNLFRNAFVMYAVDFSIFGDSSFDTAHNFYGKVVISMTTMIGLLVAAFLALPEFYEDFNGLFDLPWRNGPSHDYKANIGRLMGKRQARGKDGGKNNADLGSSGDKGRSKASDDSRDTKHHDDIN